MVGVQRSLEAWRRAALFDTSFWGITYLLDKK
jgi:hypothetical protein